MSETTERLLTWRATPPGKGRWEAYSSVHDGDLPFTFVITFSRERGAFWLGGDEELFDDRDRREFPTLAGAQGYAETLERRAIDACEAGAGGGA